MGLSGIAQPNVHSDSGWAGYECPAVVGSVRKLFTYGTDADVGRFGIRGMDHRRDEETALDDFLSSMEISRRDGIGVWAFGVEMLANCQFALSTLGPSPRESAFQKLIPPG